MKICHYNEYQVGAVIADPDRYPPPCPTCAGRNDPRGIKFIMVFGRAAEREEESPPR